MAKGQVVINIVGDISDLQSKLKAGSGSLDQFSNSTRSTGDKLTSVGSKLTMGLTGPLVAGFSLAAKAAADEGQEMAVLANTMRNTVGATDEQVAATEAWITATQNATGVSDGELRPALGKLLIAGRSVEQAQKDMAVALDIAAARGVSVEAVTTAMAKAATGNTGALGKMGVAVKDASGNALSLDEILQGASKTMGGAAAAAADTAAGRAKILQAKMADLTEEIGTKVIPVMEKVVGGVGNVVDAFTGLPGPAQTGILALAGIAAAAGPIMTVAGNVSKLADKTGELATKMKGVDVTSVGLKAGLIGMGFAAAHAAATAEDLGDKLTEAFAEAEQPTSELVAAFDQVGGSLEFFEDVADRNLTQAVRLRDGLRELGRDTSDLDAIISDHVAKQREVESSTAAATDQIEGEGEASAETTEKVGELTRSLEEYKSALDDALGVQLDTREAHRQTREAVDELTEAVSKGRTADETAIQYKDRVAESLDNVVKSIRDEVDAMAESGEISKTGASRTQTLIDKLTDLKGKYPALAGEIDGFIAAARAAAEKSGAEGQRLASEWIRGATAGFRDGAGQVVASADSIARQVNTAVRSTWRVQSPSKVAHEIGENWTEGLAEGIDAGASDPLNRAVALADSLADATGDALGGVRAITNRREAQRDLTQAEEELAELRERRKDLPGDIEEAEAAVARARRRHGKDSDELRDAEERLADLREERSGIGIAVREAEDALTEARLRAIDAEQNLREAGQALIDMGPEQAAYFQSLATAAGLTRTEIAELTEDINDLRDAGRTSSVGRATQTSRQQQTANTRRQLEDIARFVGETWSPDKLDRITGEIGRGERSIDSVIADVDRRINGAKTSVVNLTVNQRPGEKLDERKLVDLMVKAQRKYGPLPVAVRR